MNSRLLRNLLLATTTLAASSASVPALQLVEGRDGVTVEASISIKEPTRIRIDGAVITDVFGNLYSNTCGGVGTAAPGAAQGAAAVNPAGEIVLECDRDKGEIYIRPVGESAKPINLFVSSAKATYTLLLRRVDMPADTIVIRDKTPRQAKSDGPGGTRGPLGGSSNHIRSLKSLLVSMATDRVPSDVRVEEINRPVQLWVEARFSLMRVYEGRGLIGEKYLLTNVSDKPMVLAEQEFDREEGSVVAVAIEYHNLRPGESTSVYVIRLGG